MNRLIDLQTALDLLEKDIAENGEAPESDYNLGINHARAVISAIPSAQPDIIRCKECKHSDHWYKDKRRCFLWHESGIDVFEDGFCNYAKRKENG